LVPEARVAVMPPMEASAPGSMGKNSPMSRRCSLSCLRVTPGSTTTSRSSAWTATIRFIREVSTEMPPKGALTWPSSEEPVPKGMTGTSWAAAILITATQSSVDSAKTTTSGGWFSIQVSVWACCWRTACEVTARLPKRACSAPMAASSVAGSGRVRVAAVMARVLASASGRKAGNGMRTLEHFREKWIPVHVKKMRQDKRLERFTACVER